VSDTSTETQTETEDQDQQSAELPPPSERFLNRELSWLDFNDRVVELGPGGRPARPGRRRGR
jgi:hypothetical protein